MTASSLLIGSLSVALWSWIAWQASRGPIGIVSARSLFAIGILLFYSVPSLYWQLRPWTSQVPPYLEGLPLVFLGSIVLGIPFLVRPRIRRRRGPTIRERFGLIQATAALKLWMTVPLLAVAVLWRLYLFTLGYQARFTRDTPTLFGSEALAFIPGNLTYYHPILYFALFAWGTRTYRRLGLVFWILDGFLTLLALQRFSILFFAFRSIVFLELTGHRFRPRHWLAIGVCGIAILGFFGKVQSNAGDALEFGRQVQGESGRQMLGPMEILSVVGRTVLDYGRLTDQAPLLNTVDTAMMRLYDARSASAVMMGVPDAIPYMYGETFLQVLFAAIPRYLWSAKPVLSDVHLITAAVMKDDIGVNPTGTIAELYLNYGFVAIFLGGVLCSRICLWLDHALAESVKAYAVWICVYPMMTEWLLGASYNLSQRLSEGVRGVIIFGLVTLLRRFVRARQIQFGWLARPKPLSAAVLLRTKCE